MFHRKSMWMFTILLMIALATMGVGYAFWSANLIIDGAVTTGEVDAAWEMGPAPTTDEGGTDPEDLATCTATVGGVDQDTLTFVIEGGFEGYSCTIIGSYRNTGTIPWIAGAATIAYDPTAIDIDFTPGFPDCSTPGGIVNPNETRLGGLIITVLEGAEMGQTYEGTYTLELVQWDEWDPSMCTLTPAL